MSIIERDEGTKEQSDAAIVACGRLSGVLTDTDAPGAGHEHELSTHSHYSL